MNIIQVYAELLAQQIKRVSTGHADHRGTFMGSRTVHGRIKHAAEVRQIKKRQRRRTHLRQMRRKSCL
jgi:hypothetical protein